MISLYDITTNTDILKWLTTKDLYCLRNVCIEMNKIIEKDLLKDYRKIRNEGYWYLGEEVPITCYAPSERINTQIFWCDYIPAMIPKKFWNYFTKFFCTFVNMNIMKNWIGFIPKTVNIFNEEKWRVSMTIYILPSVYYYNDPVEAHYISIGISTVWCLTLGIAENSIGYHSDDGFIYQDALIVGKGDSYGVGDEIKMTLDYQKGTIEFEKNNILMCLLYLNGKMLRSRLRIGITTNSSHIIFFTMHT